MNTPLSNPFVIREIYSVNEQVQNVLVNGNTCALRKLILYNFKGNIEEHKNIEGFSQIFFHTEKSENSIDSPSIYYIKTTELEHVHSQCEKTDAKLYSIQSKSSRTLIPAHDNGRLPEIFGLLFLLMYRSVRISIANYREEILRILI